MLIPCLWTTLPWIILGQTYYMSFVFNNYGYGIRPSIVEAPDLGLSGTKKPPKRVQDTLELSSMEESSQSIEPIAGVDDDSSDSDDFDFSIKQLLIPKNKPKLKPPKVMENPTTTRTTKTLKTTGTPEIIKTSKTPGTSGTTKITETLETADTPETAEEITTESIKSTESEEAEDETTEPLDTSTVTWPPVTPHPREFFDYPEADCHEDMDLHEVFGIRLERDRGLATKILCQFNNSWGGPWLLMTRVELPVRIHMRHWFLGYVTEDYKDLNINFLALAHIMNTMRTAMLILGQDENDRLVYNLYDDVVISAFNDVFMMRKAELVEANATDMLFLSVGKTLSSYGGLNRTCPLQVLGSWWGNTVQQTEVQLGLTCVFPRERNVTQPGYMAIFIKPSLFRSNNTAFYDEMITTRRPWGLTVNTGLMEEVKNNKTEYEIRQNQQFRRSKRIVQNELARRSKIFDAIEKMRRLQLEMQRGR